MTDLTLAVCVYNAEQYICETLESVLAQTYQDFNLLIVNDCSTDKSSVVIERFFDSHPRQHEIVDFDNNMGIAYARHYAELHSATRFMMFLDADDSLYPEAVEKMYDRISSDDDLMAVGCYQEYVNAEGKKLGGGIYLGAKTKEEFYDKASHGKRIFMQVTAVYDRKTALSVGGFTVDGFQCGDGVRYQDYCEDLDLWTRMSDLYKQEKAIVVVPEVLCRYRKAEGLSSGTFPMILKMRYVKENLLRRRAGQGELTFVEFYSGLSEKEIKGLQRDAKAAENLRNGVFYLHQRQLLRALCLIVKVLCSHPAYLWDKIRNNSGWVKHKP